MAVALRLMRMGRKKAPLYAIVATDSRSRRDGRFIEDLGRYEPVQEPAVVKINAERVMYWLRQGAQPSDTVRNLLSREGLMLHLHLVRKGKDESEIAEAVEAFKNKETAAKSKVTKRARAAEALKANGANLRTALGSTLHVAVYAGPEISLWDKDRNARNPRVILAKVDINKGNKQIAHGIDRVLRPVDLPPAYHG